MEEARHRQKPREAGEILDERVLAQLLRQEGIHGPSDRTAPKEVDPGAAELAGGGAGERELQLPAKRPVFSGAPECGRPPSLSFWPPLSEFMDHLIPGGAPAVRRSRP